MSRRRKHETAGHRSERERRRLRAAEKRHLIGRWRRAVATALWRRAQTLGKSVRLIWWHIPRSWGRRLRTGKPL